MSDTRIFVSRIAGAGLFDPTGERVGKVRDVLVTMRHTDSPVVGGLIVEVVGRRRVFLQINRVINITAGAVITTGMINVRRFVQRGGEVRVIAELLGRSMRLRDGSGTARIEDVAIEQARTLEWSVSEVFLRRPKTSASLFARGATVMARWEDLTEELHPGDIQDASQLLATYSELKAADLATALMDLPDKRRAEVAENLPDERLADVLEELGPQDQLTLIGQLDDDRAAVVLDRMQPDDAADLIAQLAITRRETLLGLMAPEEASDVRMLLRFAPDTAGGLMTTEPLIASADTTVAEGLAMVSREEIPPGTATSVCLTLPPYDAPTGRFIGVVHFQRMLRYPPSERLGTLVDDTVDPLSPETSIAEVARTLATYNLTSIPVVDGNRRLLGIITVDDVLDALLPDDWRNADAETEESLASLTEPGVS
ncbi:MAG: CBS domain-containing protein [Pseudoclavibacter sp.]